MMTRAEDYSITGMHCAACAASIERVVSRQGGVEAVGVNLATERMRVRGDFDTDAILSAVSKAGFSADIVEDAKKQDELDRARKADELKRQSLRAYTALGFAIPLFVLAMAPMLGVNLPVSMHQRPMLYALLQILLLIPIIVCGFSFYTSGVRALLRLHPNMDSLVATGTLASVVYSLWSLLRLINGDASAAHDMYWESAGVIIALVMLGKNMEARSKRKTYDAVERMLSLTPDTATVLHEDGAQETVPASQLVVGDVVLVRPGERIPADGALLDAHASVDESMLTGESIPAEKANGDALAGGSVNRNIAFAMRVTRIGADTTLSNMIRMVEDAQSAKAPISRLADRIAAIFVPVVFLIALVAAAVWLLAGQSVSFALNAFVSVLVIACPCALGLATPTAVMVGTGVAASQGVFIKSGETLETLHDIKAVAFDKTGTLTLGQPQLVRLYCGDGTSQNELLALLASVEQYSEHPLAHALVEAAKERGVSLKEASCVQAYAGFGVGGALDESRILAGSAAFMRNEGVAPHPIDDDDARGCTLVYLAKDDVCLGAAALLDEPREDAFGALQRLTERGLHVCMITGDRSEAAGAVASRLGSIDVIAEVPPENKADAVRKLQAQFGKVAMVGDGVNDAPALASADVGVAIGAGTDVAIASADVVLMRSSLYSVDDAITISAQSIRTIKQNLFWAFFYNCIGIPIAAGLLYVFGGPLLSPMIAALAMSFSSVTVVSNALLLRGRCMRSLARERA